MSVYELGILLNQVLLVENSSDVMESMPSLLTPHSLIGPYGIFS
jgi:hypothetical protein